MTAPNPAVPSDAVQVIDLQPGMTLCFDAAYPLLPLEQFVMMSFVSSYHAGQPVAFSGFLPGIHALLAAEPWHQASTIEHYESMWRSIAPLLDHWLGQAEPGCLLEMDGLRLQLFTGDAPEPGVINFVRKWPTLLSGKI